MPARRSLNGARIAAWSASAILLCLLLTPAPDPGAAGTIVASAPALAAANPTPSLVPGEDALAASKGLTPEEVAVLEERLRALIASCPGDPALVVMPPDASWTIAHDAEETTSAASLIKLPIHLALDRLAADGRIDPGMLVTLEGEDRTPGSGRLRDARAGRTFRLRELAERMIVESDNTATNAIIRLVGQDTLQAEFLRLGLRATRLERRILAQGGDNATTAAEMALLLAALPEGPVRETLERVENRRRLARDLPAATPIAHKTGTLRRFVHDAGRMETPHGPLIVVGLVRHASSWPEAEDWLAALGRTVYEAGGEVVRDRDIVR